MRYTWRDGDWRDRDGNPMEVPKRDGLCMPHVVSDIPAYQSPIDGKWITTRSARRYDLAANGCVEADPPKKKRGYINESFAAKRGLKLREDAAEVRKSFAAKAANGQPGADR